MAFSRRSFSGASAITTLNGDINATATSVIVADATGWPTGSTGPFYAVIAPEQAGEEKILVTSRSGTTLILADSADRGVDGSTAQAHTAGDTIYHSFTAVDADEANYTAFNTVGKVTTKGDTIAATGANALGRVPVGADDHFYLADPATTTGVRWGPLPDAVVNSSAKFAPGVVDTAALATNAVTTPKITNAAITVDKIATAAVTTAALAADSVTAAKIASNAVGTTEIVDNAVTTAAITDANVTTAKLADSSVTTAKLNDDAVTAAKVLEGVIPTTVAAGYTSSASADSTNASYTAWGGTTDVTIPAWANTAYITCVVSTVLPVTASATVNFRLMLGANTSSAVRQDVNGMEDVARQIVMAVPITLTATGSQPLVMQAQRTAGGGAFRATDSVTRFDYLITFTT